MKQIVVNVEKTLADYFNPEEKRYFVLKHAGDLMSVCEIVDTTHFIWHNPFGYPTSDMGETTAVENGPFNLRGQLLEVYENTKILDMVEYIHCMSQLDTEVTSQRFKKPKKAKIESNTFVLKNYESRTMYTGKQSYHSHHGASFNKPLKDVEGYKIGVELEVECNSADREREVTGIKSNFIYMESDGSLGSYGVELITIPLLPADAKSRKTWEGVVSFLSKRAKSWNTGRCGLHVHIGREILGKTAEEQSETIGKMLYLYHQFLKDDPINRKIYGRDRAYNDHDGKTKEGSAVEVLGSEILKNKTIKERVKKAMIDRSSTDRYFDINLRNTATIEFRKGRGSINVNRIVSIIEYSELIALYARKVRWDKISKEHFYEFCRAKTKCTSPLYDYIGACESC